MNHNRKRTQAHCTSPDLVHNLLTPQSKGQFSRNGRFKSPYLPQCEQTESLHSLTQESLFQLQKSNTSLGSNKFLSDSLHNQNQQSPFSGSSSFGTNLHVSSSTSSETNQQLGNPPFLPHLPAYDQCTSVANSSKNPLIVGGDVIDRRDKEISEDSTKNFLDLARESFDGLSYVEDSLTLTDDLDLEYLSAVLDNISENGENPKLEEIFKAPQVASNPTIGFEFNENHDSSVAQMSNRVRPVHCLHDVAATNKPRMRWTTELHELFLDAVNKLDDPEKATPKTIWMLMNVNGLTIYHVKSHLQKYRLTKSVEEPRQDKTVNSSEEDKPASTSNNSGAHPESGMLVTEAMRMQIALQKQLHEHLVIQKDLQLCIEKNGEYLRKILEEQQKTGSTLLPVDGLPLLTDTNSESELLPLSASNDASSSQKGSL